MVFVSLNENTFSKDRCNTPILHPPITTCHLSLFHLNSHLKKSSPTHNGQKPKNKNQSGASPIWILEREKEKQKKNSPASVWVAVASRGFSPFLSRSPSSSSSALFFFSLQIGFAPDLVLFFWFGTVNVMFQSYYWVWVSFFFKCKSNGRSCGGMLLLVCKTGVLNRYLLNVFSKFNKKLVYTSIRK